MLKGLGIEIPSIESNEITITADSNIAGDLAGMLNLKNILYIQTTNILLRGIIHIMSAI